MTREREPDIPDAYTVVSRTTYGEIIRAQQEAFAKTIAAAMTPVIRPPAMIQIDPEYRPPFDWSPVGQWWREWWDIPFAAFAIAVVFLEIWGLTR